MSNIDEDFINLLQELKIVKPRVKDTLGVPRNKMPQIARQHYDEYFEYMKEHGVTFVKQTIPVKDIKATQKEFSDAGVIKSVLKGKIRTKIKPVIISSDNFIIDGHHRWLATLNISPNERVDVVRASAKGKEVLQLTLKFKRVTFKTIYERASMIDDGIDYLAEMTVDMKAKINAVIANRYDRQSIAAMHKLVTSKKGRHSLGHYALQIGKVYDIGDTRKFVAKYKETFAEELEGIGGFKARKSDKKNKKIDIPRNGRIDGYAPIGNSRPMHVVRSHNLESVKMEEDKIKTVKTLPPQQIAKKHKVSLRQIMDELKSGIEVEQEHTTDKKIARKIALAHLAERPDYYTMLIKAEKSPIKKLGEDMYTVEMQEAKYGSVFNHSRNPSLPRHPGRIGDGKQKMQSKPTGEWFDGFQKQLSVRVPKLDPELIKWDSAKGYKAKGQDAKKAVNTYIKNWKIAKSDIEEHEMNTFARVKNILSEDGNKKKLDPVNKKAVKKDFEDRKDQDLDNDGDVDSSDKYLHKRRKAISKNIGKKKNMDDNENYYDDNNKSN